MQHFVPHQEHRGLLREGSVKEMHLPPGAVFWVEFSVWGSTSSILGYLLQKQPLQKWMVVFF